MEYVWEIGLFARKTFVVLTAVLIVLLLGFGLFSRGKTRPQLDVEKLNHRFKTMQRIMAAQMLGKKEFKAGVKKEKKSDKGAEKSEQDRTRVYVLDFEGDVRASDVQSLREEVTAILEIARPSDEVVL